MPEFRKIIIATILVLLSVLFLYCDKDPENGDNGNGEPQEVTEVLGGGDFEEWIEITQGEVSFEKPAGGWWGSLNTLSFIGGPITVTKTDDSYLGNYAAKLKTQMWGNDLMIPGILASGYFDKDLPMGENLVIGQAFDNKPISFNGHYKYYPQGNDSLVILIALTKFHNDTHIRDTIANAEFVTGETVSEYTPFVLFLDYHSNENPDSIHIILLSSVNGQKMQGYEGSTLYIDELSLTYEE